MLNKKSKLFGGFILIVLILSLTLIPIVSAQSSSSSLFNAAALFNFGERLAFFNFLQSDAKSVEKDFAPESCAPAPGDLVAWYRAENNANDSAGTNNGTISGGATFAPGKVGQSFNLDGSDDAIRLPLNQSFQNFTLEAWVKPLAAVNDPINQELLLGQAAFGSQIVVRPGTNGGMSVVVQYRDTAVSFAQLSSSGDIPLNDWSHLVGTYDGTTLKLYINGILNAQMNPPNTAVLTCNTPYFIGGFEPVTDCGGNTNPAFQFFNGLIDEASIYDRALADGEIQSIFNAGSAGKCASSCTLSPANQVSWWRGENNGSDSQATNNGTMQNGADFAPGLVGQGFRFDADNEHLLIPASPSLDVGANGSLTLEAWVNPTSVNPGGSGYGPIFEWNSGGGVQFGRFDNGVLFANIQATNGSNRIVQTGNTAIVPNQFQHVALTYSSATGVGTIYVNGVVAATQNLGSFTPRTNTELRLGVRGGSDSFKGIIDEPAIYNRALSQTEIQGIFNAGSAGKCEAAALQIAPATANVATGGTVNFSGISGAAPYTFSILTNNSGGSINASTGVYTAGNSIGTDTVRVTDASNATANATVSVTASCVNGQKTWDGGGAGENWSEAANWTCDLVPNSSDTIIFDGTSTKNATIDTSLTLRNLQINNGYTGTITQAAAFHHRVQRGRQHELFRAIERHIYLRRRGDLFQRNAVRFERRQI